MTVYAVHALGTNLVKVGFTRATDNIKKRLYVLQQGVPHQLVVLAIAPTAPTMIEWKYHKMLSAFCVRGEWYALNEDQRTRLADCLRDEPAYAADHEERIMRFARISTRAALRAYIKVDRWKADGEVKIESTQLAPRSPPPQDVAEYDHETLTNAVIALHNVGLTTARMYNIMMTDIALGAAETKIVIRSNGRGGSVRIKGANKLSLDKWLSVRPREGRRLFPCSKGDLRDIMRAHHGVGRRIAPPIDTSSD